MKNIYDLVIPFDDQSESFTLGVEAGMFWQRIESGENEFAMLAHVKNELVMKRMARSRGLITAFEPIDDCWAHIDVMPNSNVSQEIKKPQLKLIDGGIDWASSKPNGGRPA